MQDIHDLRELLISTEEQIAEAKNGKKYPYDEFFVACQLRRLRRDRINLQKAIFDLE